MYLSYLSGYREAAAAWRLPGALGALTLVALVGLCGQTAVAQTPPTDERIRDTGQSH